MKRLHTILLLLVVLAGAYFYFPAASGDVIDLEKIVAQSPELISYVNEVQSALPKLDETNVATYATLGLAWKGLADQTRDKEHYLRAYKIYEEAVNLTQRKNTLFISNAGNMAIYLENYEVAREYYEETVSVAPGGMDGYRRLIELHIYQLKSDKDTIIAIFDRGIKRMVTSGELVRWRESYIASVTDTE